MERCLGDVLLLDADSVITGAEVHLGEVPSVMEAIQEVVDVRDGVAVLNGDHVEGAVVHTKAEDSILLFHKEDTGGTILVKYRATWRLSQRSST